MMSSLRRASWGRRLSSLRSSLASMSSWTRACSHYGSASMMNAKEMNPRKSTSGFSNRDWSLGRSALEFVQYNHRKTGDAPEGAVVGNERGAAFLDARRRVQRVRRARFRAARISAAASQSARVVGASRTSLELSRSRKSLWSTESPSRRGLTMVSTMDNSLVTIEDWPVWAHRHTGSSNAR